VHRLGGDGGPARGDREGVLKRPEHHEGINVAERRMRERKRQAACDFETEALPELDGSCVMLTTKLNCMARNPRERACSREWEHIARATPRPVDWGAVMYPQLATCDPPALLIGLEEIGAEDFTVLFGNEEFVRRSEPVRQRGG
jgi:hypothetical protein